MKRIWVALSLMIICSAFACTEFIIVKYKSTEFFDLVETAEVYFSEREFSKSYNTLDSATKKWEKSEKILNIFLSHEKVDEVEESLSELSKHAENKDKTLFYATSEKAKRQLLCLKQSELPNLENIM